MNSLVNPKYKAIILIIVGCFFSVLNDIITKQLNQNINPHNIIFCRNIFSLVIGLLLWQYISQNKFKIKFSLNSLSRSLLIYIALILWCCGLKNIHIPIATTISFLSPLVAVGLAHFLLNEQVKKRELKAIILCFIGVIISFTGPTLSYDKSIIYLLTSTIIFGTLEFYNKIMSNYETPLEALISISMVGTFISFIASLYFPLNIVLADIKWLLLLGLGNVILMYCFFKAYHLADLKNLMPWKYSELLISIIFSTVIYEDKLTLQMLAGFIIVITTHTYIFFKTMRKENI